MERLSVRESLLAGPHVEEGYHGDKTCCGKNGCDGYGHIEAGNGWRACPNKAKPPRVPFLAEYGASRWRETIHTLACKEFVKRIKRNPGGDGILILLDGNGVGKTTVLKSVQLDCVNHGITSRLANWSSILEQKQRGIDGEKVLADWYYALKTNRVIFVDEVGRSKPSQKKHEPDLLQSIIRKCHRKRYLVLASNCTRLEMKPFVNMYCNDRFREVAVTTIIEGNFDNNESFRRAK